MDKWEYLNVRLRLHQFSGPGVKPYWEYSEEQADGSLLTGMGEVFNRYGHLGWEMVAMMPQYTEGNINTSVTILSAVFKRRVE